MLPSLDSLRCFVAAARLLHFRRAAKTVALTPAAFGQRIKQLEEQLGVALFSRTTREVQLTRHGAALLPAALRCLEAAEACGRAARGEQGEPPLELVVGTRHELGMSWLVPGLDALAQALSHVTFHLYFGSGSDLFVRLRSHEIDCAVTSMRVDDPRLDARVLHREDYVLVASPALVAKRPLRKPEHASAHVLLDTSPDLALFRYFRDASSEHDLRFSRVVSLGTTEAVKARVLAGVGVAVLPLYQVRPELATRALARLLPRAPLLHDHFRLVFRASDVRAPLFDALAEALRALPLR